MDERAAIVRAGYDAIADAYVVARAELFTSSERAFLDRVVDSIGEGVRVVELGCGPGVPCTSALARKARVVGVDLSAAQLARARQLVPRARFVRADMTSLALRPGSIDAVVAFASFGHVPWERHGGLIGSIATWLRPGGLFASQHPTGHNPQEIGDWFGVPMFFSHPDIEETKRLLRSAGFAVASIDDVHGVEPDGSAGIWAGILAHRSPA